MEDAAKSEDNAKTSTAKNALHQEATTKDVFVGNLSYYSTAEKIKMHFAKFGQVRDVRLFHRPGSRQSRRYCFLTFSNEASARSAIAATNHLVDGKCLVVRPASNRQDSAATADKTTGADKRAGAKIFIGGIGQEIDSEALASHFSAFGKVLSAEILRDRETKRCRGFAFVEFSSGSSAELACSQQYHMLGKRRVEVKLAQPQSVKTSNEVRAVAAPLLDNQALQKVVLDQWVSSIKTLQHYSMMLSQNYGQQQCMWPASTSASHRFSPYFVPTQNEYFGFVPFPPLNPMEVRGVIASQQDFNIPTLAPAATVNPHLLQEQLAHGLVAQMPFVQYASGKQ